MKVPCCFTLYLIRADAALKKCHFDLIQKVSCYESWLMSKCSFTSCAAFGTLSYTNPALAVLNFKLLEQQILQQGSKHPLETGSKYGNRCVEWHITAFKINEVILRDVIK